MIVTNGSGDHQTVAEARPVVLVRYRPGVTDEATRTVHLVPLPLDSQHDAATALCGTVLLPSEMETVTPGHGMPCNRCLISQVAASPPPPTLEPSQQAAHPDAGHQDAAAGYHGWGWPVTVHRDQVRLNLAPDTVALIIPAPLAAEVTEILTARRCLPAVLDHPYAPEHRVLLAGEPYPVALPWPPGVDRITATVLLPPTRTPRGPLRWVHPPHRDSLKLCREIDVRAAVRTALQRSPREEIPMSEDRVPLWRDPLFSPGVRFPLGPSHGIMDDCEEGPSGPATRPFSLRRVVAGTRLAGDAGELR